MLNSIEQSQAFAPLLRKGGRGCLGHIWTGPIALDFITMLAPSTRVDCPLGRAARESS
jgi:hypothetical protein